MYPITNAVKALFDAEQRQVLRITGTDRNGTAISITDANVMQGGFNIDRRCCNSEKLEIGTAVAAELTLKLDNRQGQFSSIVFEGAELFVEIGIADWSQSNPTTYWIPCGYFTPDEQPRTLSVITIHALDRMMKLDKAQPTTVGWGDASSNRIVDANSNRLVFRAMLSFPTTVGELVAQICSYCGVTLATDLSNFPNYGTTLLALPSIQQTITYRMLIQWCAGLMGSNAFFDWNGQLRFSFYGSSSVYTTTTANRFSSDMQESNIVFTGVKYTNTSGGTNVAGTSGYCFDLTGNYLLGSSASSMLLAIRPMVAGFYYRPFKASVINAPYLWPMDRVTYTDANGNGHLSSLTNVNFGLNGATDLESKGETAQTASLEKGSGLTMAEGYYIEKAAEQTKQLDASLNQEQIFNRLTNNGETQGLILYNGKVYLNASYIQTGELSADFIKAGVLSDAAGLNSWNLVTGVLSMIGSLLTRYTSGGHTIGININNGALTFQVDNQSIGSLQPTNDVGSLWDSGKSLVISGSDGINIVLETTSSDDAVSAWSGLYLLQDGTVKLCCTDLKIIDNSGGILPIDEPTGYTGEIQLSDGSINVLHGIITGWNAAP